jgi:hypothetical protein
MAATTKYIIVCDPWDYEPTVIECDTIKEAMDRYEQLVKEGYYSDLYFTKVLQHNQPRKEKL